MILYFLRHGQAGSHIDWKGDDAERPLTKKGKESMYREAETIVQLDLQLDAIITSPLARALQTAEVVGERLMMGERLFQDERLSPGFDGEALAEILEEYKQANAIMLVGHEPDFSETIGALTGGRVIVKKGGLARVDLQPDSGSLTGDLVWLIPPKALIR
jgi:phosphohistidine phosphatase